MGKFDEMKAALAARVLASADDEDLMEQAAEELIALTQTRQIEKEDR